MADYDKLTDHELNMLIAERLGYRAVRVDEMEWSGAWEIHDKEDFQAGSGFGDTANEAWQRFFYGFYDCEVFGWSKYIDISFKLLEQLDFNISKTQGRDSLTWLVEIVETATLTSVYAPTLPRAISEAWLKWHDAQAK